MRRTAKQAAFCGRQEGETVKYIVQVEIDPETGAEIEKRPQEIQAVVGKWQALKPIGMHFSLTRRSITIVLDVPNEDAMFEALHATWVLTNDYPDVSPVVDVDEFPAVLQRVAAG
jgi:hypothetical protein